MKRRDFLFSTGLGLIGTALGLTPLKKIAENAQSFEDGKALITGLEITLDSLYVDRFDAWEASGSYTPNWGQRYGDLTGTFSITNCLPSYGESIIEAFDKGQQVRFVLGSKGQKGYFSGYGIITDLTIDHLYDGTSYIYGSMKSVGSVSSGLILNK